MQRRKKKQRIEDLRPPRNAELQSRIDQIVDGQLLKLKWTRAQISVVALAALEESFQKNIEEETAVRNGSAADRAAAKDHKTSRKTFVQIVGGGLPGLGKSR